MLWWNRRCRIQVTVFLRHFLMNYMAMKPNSLNWNICMFSSSYSLAINLLSASQNANFWNSPSIHPQLCSNANNVIFQVEKKEKRACSSLIATALAFIHLSLLFEYLWAPDCPMHGGGDTRTTFNKKMLVRSQIIWNGPS